MSYKRILATLWAVLCLPVFASSSYDDPTPKVDLGAKVYYSRCVLCHGNKGMGEGILPMRLKNYPDTALLTAKSANSRDEVLQATVFGAHYKNLSEFMPPFGKELSWTELESVSDFIMLMRSNKEQAYALLSGLDSETSASKKIGQHVYSTRCVLCHGGFGEGDGRMSKLLKTPPPADLTASRLPDGYLKDIIVKGGEAMGRSKHMPPWGDQLTETEIQSLMLYLKAIRD
jgi:mono/diheme cytochrome c family protein